MGIFDVFTTDAADKAAAARKAGLTSGFDKASGYFDKSRGALEGNYASALMPFTGLQSTATGAFDLAGDITGARGAEGQARARTAFQTDPGYEFARDEALQGVERSGASRGMLNSGNTLMALQDRASGLAEQQYGNWANRALGVAGMAPGIAGQQAGIYTGLGGALSQNYGQQGQLGYQTEAGIGEAQAQADLDANRASGQFWNTALGVADLGVKLATGGISPSTFGAKPNINSGVAGGGYAGTGGQIYPGPGMYRY